MVIVRDQAVVLYNRIEFLDVATEEEHSSESKSIVDKHYNAKEIGQWLDEVTNGLYYDSGGFDFIQKGEQLKHPDEDAKFKEFDDQVVILGAVFLSQVSDCNGVQNLAQSFWPNSKMFFITFKKANDHEVCEQF